MESGNQEAPRRRSRPLKGRDDADAITSGEVFDEKHQSESGEVFDEKPQRESVEVFDEKPQSESGEVFDEKPQSESGLDVEVSRWAVVHPDILRALLGFLPCLADRASVRSVCCHWRTTGRSSALPPPLPLLVLPTVRLSYLSSEGALTAARRVLIPDEMGADRRISCVGSCDGWLVLVVPRKRRDVYDFYSDYSDCFLVNAFSHAALGLPRCDSHSAVSHYFYRILPIINGYGDRFYCRKTNNLDTKLFHNVVLSASPDSGSRFIVAASSEHRISTDLVLWQPGMISWLVCDASVMEGPKDLAFLEGKLYVLLKLRPFLFTIELEGGDCEIMVSRVERCVTELLPPHHRQRGGLESINMVVWRERLLLIVRYHDPYYQNNIVKVRVFALELGTNPYGVTEIHGLDGDCIFVGSGGSKSFLAHLHDVVEGDLIYFVPDYYNPYDTFVYNMRDGRMRPFAVDLLMQFCPSLSPYKFGSPKDDFDFPVWLLPSE